jgi:hypothetical protein
MNFENIRGCLYIIFVLYPDQGAAVMTGKENKADKLSKNYRELDTDGQNTLSKIGEKVFMVKEFVNKEISLLVENNDINKEFENE